MGKLAISAKTKIKSFKKTLSDMSDDAMALAMASGADKARQHYAKRWAGITAHYGGTGIDYTIPVISLEYKLADPTVIRDIRTKSGAEVFRASLSPEELEIYLKGWSEDGSRSRPYSDLEKQSKREIRKAALAEIESK